MSFYEFESEFEYCEDDYEFDSRLKGDDELDRLASEAEAQEDDDDYDWEFTWDYYDDFDSREASDFGIDDVRKPKDREEYCFHWHNSWKARSKARHQWGRNAKKLPHHAPVVYLTEERTETVFVDGWGWKSVIREHLICDENGRLITIECKEKLAPSKGQEPRVFDKTEMVFLSFAWDLHWMREDDEEERAQADRESEDEEEDLFQAFLKLEQIKAELLERKMERIADEREIELEDKGYYQFESQCHGFDPQSDPKAETVYSNHDGRNDFYKGNLEVSSSRWGDEEDELFDLIDYVSDREEALRKRHIENTQRKLFVKIVADREYDPLNPKFLGFKPMRTGMGERRSGPKPKPVEMRQPGKRQPKCWKHRCRSRYQWGKRKQRPLVRRIESKVEQAYRRFDQELHKINEKEAFLRRLRKLVSGSEYLRCFDRDELEERLEALFAA